MDVKENIHLSVFKLQLPSSALSSCSNDISVCARIERLLSSLKYYDQLNASNHENGKQLFCDFMDTIYESKIFDDFYHLTKCHQKDLIDIKDLAISQYKMTKCELSNCNHSDRHFRVRTDHIYNNDKKNNIDDDKYWKLHQETMDTLHFYVFHLYQGGLRHTPNETEIIQDGDNISPYFDAVFQRICVYVKRSRGSADRFNRLHGNKFDISAVSGARTLAIVNEDA